MVGERRTAVVRVVDGYAAFIRARGFVGVFRTFSKARDEAVYALASAPVALCDLFEELRHLPTPKPASRAEILEFSTQFAASH